MGPNHVTLARFSAAFGSGDVDAIMARMTDDCVFESTGPEPDGQHHDGQDAVRAVWERLFDETRDPKFTDEDAFLSGDRACLRRRFTGPMRTDPRVTFGESTSSGSATGRF
jgi:ketosteroid isomerase-like protein